MRTSDRLRATAAILGLLSLAPPPGAASPAPSAAAAQAPYAALSWRMVGPMRGGRTHAVAGVPGQPAVFYVGAVNGGVWKTEDDGRTWQPVFDGQPTQSIGAIAVAPSAPATIYVASGEGLARPDLSVGDGIYRSQDGGRTWTHLGLADGQQIPELAVDPHDPARVFAAVLGHPYGPSAERGIYRSVDAGATWQRVLHRDDNTGGSAVAIDPLDPQVVYAGLWESRLGPWEDKNDYNGTGGGLFKSTDGGTTWTQLKAGLPENLAQVGIAIAPSSPHRIYASVATTEPGDYSSAAGLGIYRSDDAGATWKKITIDPRPALRIGGGDLAVLRVDPTNADVVYSASIVTMKSVDGGVTWQPLRGAPGGDDYQNLWISPTDPRIIALVADQGALITLNGGATWSSWFNQPTAQLYHVAVTPSFPYRVCAGQQESGSVCIASRGSYGSITERDWQPVGVIEYGYVAPDPLDPNLIYGAGRNEVTRFNLTTGQVVNVTPIPLRGAAVRVDRTEPLLFAPTDPHTLYYAANRLWRSHDGGASWEAVSPDLAREAGYVPPSVGERHEPGAEKQRGVIYSLGLSPLDGARLWAGTDDGYVWTSADAGAHWDNVTPAELTPWSKVTQIESSHFDAATAYVAVSRMRIDDLHPYVYRTRDGGRTWQPIAAGLPADAPVNAVREDPQRRGLLYAATEKSVWVSFDDGAHWESLQLNLPHTSMRDLAIAGDDLVVATHGRSFWILDDITPLRQAGATAPAGTTLFQPAPAFRLYRSTWPDTPLPPDEPLAANPPAGAIIDYYLPHAARAPVELEILDAGGQLVRRYRSDDPPDPDPAQLARELIPQYWLSPPRSLPVSAGAHRWTWDLRYSAPLAVVRGYPIGAVPHSTPPAPEGPLALPGRYRVRLTVDGQHYETPLTIEPDPRVQVTPAALAAQLGLARELAASLSESSRMLLTARSEAAQAKDLLAAHGAPAALAAWAQRLDPLLTAPTTPAGNAPPTLTAVQADIGSLYQEVTRGDGAPTAAQAAAAADLGREFEGLRAQWQPLQSALAAVNDALRAAKLAPIRPELAPPRDPNLADEE